MSALQQHLVNKINERAADDPELMGALGRLPVQLSISDVEIYQLHQLKKALAYVYSRSSFYKNLLDKHKFNPGNVRALSDLADLGFTEPSDVAANSYAFACVSQAEIARATTFTSSGTTGPQKRIFFTEHDLKTMIDFMSAGISTVAKEGDTVQIMLPAGPENSQADLLSKGIKKMGGIPVVIGTAPTERQLEAIIKYKPRVLFGSVSRIYRITKELENKIDLRSLGVQTLFATSEYMSPVMKNNLRQAWGADVLLHYGMTEMGLGVAVECIDGEGFHFNQADILLEVIDPISGKVLPPGVEGEMVFTSLNRQAMPLIRYRTHDISSCIMPPCSCGADILSKFSTVRRRKENVLKVAAGEIYPSIIDDVIFNVPQVVDWRAEVVSEKGKDALKLKVEVNDPGHRYHDIIKDMFFSSDSTRLLFKGNGLDIHDIEILPSGSLTRTGRAKSTILDNRERRTS